MNSNRNINFGAGGTYNESTHIEGNNIQGDNIQGDKVEGDKNQNQNQEIMEVKNLLVKYQKNYSPDESINMAAKDLATQSKNDSSKRSKLMAMGKYLASNGGIEATTGKVIELAMKLMTGI